MAQQELNNFKRKAIARDGVDVLGKQMSNLTKGDFDLMAHGLEHKLLTQSQWTLGVFLPLWLQVDTGCFES